MTKKKIINKIVDLLEKSSEIEVKRLYFLIESFLN